MKSILVLTVLVTMALGTPATAQPDSRSFYMGMAPVAWDWNEPAFDTLYATINQHTDMILHHFDDGIPWQEALDGTPYPPEVQADIQRRLDHRIEGQTVYLAVTPIHISRDQMAGYWGQASNMPLQGEWATRTLDDPIVIEAYLNYVRYMVETFQPDYLAYGVEVNYLAALNLPVFNQYVRHVETVYPALKAEYPDLPIFLTFAIEEHFQGFFVPYIEQLLPYTDMFAISSYPFSATDVWGDATRLPENWFTQVQDVAGDLPIAVAETAFLAEDYTTADGQVIPGTPESQRVYVERLLNDAQAMNAEFVIYFVPIDYDKLTELVIALGIETPIDFFDLWQDTGLYDQDLQPRPALEVWDAWLAVPRG